MRLKRFPKWEPYASRAVGAGLLVCSLLVYGHIARSQTSGPPTGYFVAFDPPGSTSTTPSAVTASGVVLGSYVDSSGAQHGFLRNADGSYTTFDPPGSVLTTATAINPEGTVTGAWTDAAGVIHGFVRTAQGAITSFDAPTGEVENSIYLINGPPPSINPAGAVAGTTFAFDPNYTEHGFLRERNGTIITIDVPGSIGSTEIEEINSEGTLMGEFFTTKYLGFLRTRNGTFITIDVPGSVNGTYANCINSAGAIAGEYDDANSVSHGFVRSPNGTITSFDAPGSAFIEVYAINSEGTITGYYFTDTFHGFLRATDGAFTTFDVPGSTGTIGQAINPAGTVAGILSDTAGMAHGFLFFPAQRGEVSGVTPNASH